VLHAFLLGKGCIVSQGDGPVALVSAGSAGIGGIGAAIVRRLAAGGWDVSFGCDGDERTSREVEQAAGTLGPRVRPVRVDLADSAAVAARVRRAGEELGPAEAAVSCAGIIADRPLALIQPADCRAVTDLDGMFHLCRAAVPVMMRQRSASGRNHLGGAGVHSRVALYKRGCRTLATMASPLTYRTSR
jgi:3-oxoacyl-[acyl-carrier protein] reductase